MSAENIYNVQGEYGLTLTIMPDTSTLNFTDAQKRMLQFVTTLNIRQSAEVTRSYVRSIENANEIYFVNVSYTDMKVYTITYNKISKRLTSGAKAMNAAASASETSV